MSTAGWARRLSSWRYSVRVSKSVLRERVAFIQEVAASRGVAEIQAGYPWSGLTVSSGPNGHALHALEAEGSGRAEIVRTAPAREIAAVLTGMRIALEALPCITREG